MRQTIYKELVLISAERVDHDKKLNDTMTYMLRKDLQDYGFLTHYTIGHYNGHLEHSNMVLLNDNDLETISDLVFNKYKQESILYQDKHGYAWLIYADATRICIGKLRQVNKYEVMSLDNYTLFNGSYYAVS